MTTDLIAKIKKTTENLWKVWPDLAIFKLYLVLGQILNILWQIYMLMFFIVVYGSNYEI